MNEVVQENLHGVRVVKSFIREEHEDQKFGKISKKIYVYFAKACLLYTSAAAAGTRSMTSSSSPGISLKSEDVYKRQITDYANVRKTGLAAITLRADDELIEVKFTDDSQDIFLVTKYGPVSYTHLDVYKRQVLTVQPC